VLVHEGLVDGGRLVGGHCRACDKPHFPELTTCPYCSSDDVERRALSDRGTLWGWTAVTAAPPGYRGETPFGFGVVELPEGLRVITRITEADPDALRFGQPMKLAIVPLHADDDGNPVTTYAFEPASDHD
jgi:uncharacterized OB-fold protein